jgi:pilus assembly protein Flp/PilA
LHTLGRFLLHIVTREDGPAAVEYAVMMALIIVDCVSAITTLGSNTNKTYTSAGNAIKVGSTSS